MRRRKHIILLLIIIVLFSTIGLLLKMSLQWEVLIETNENDTKVIFYKCKLFSYYICGIRYNNPLKMKIFHISKDNLPSPKIVHNLFVNYILFVNKDTFEMFLLDGSFITSKKIAEENDRIISSSIGDIDNDSNDEILFITGNREEKYGNKMLIFSLEKEINKIYEQSFDKLNPWKIQVADVDGDEKNEISLGVYKKSKFHPVMAKRPFLYSWEEDEIFPKWRGSRLSKPFEDYIFADIDQDGMDELISIEITLNGSKVINSYKWKGFGFESMSESDEFEDIISFKVLDNEINKVYARVNNGDDFYWISLNYEKGRLSTIERIDNCIERYIVE